MWIAVLLATAVGIIATVSGQSVKCTFDDQPPEDCMFYHCNSTLTRWTDNQGGTASSGSGPDFDHTTGSMTGHYKYIEASGHIHQFARYATALFDNPNRMQYACVDFWFHMYGAEMGAIKVYVVDEDARERRTLIWQLGGNRGNVWTQGSAEFRIGSQFQVVFEGNVGRGTKSDMALDDIEVTLGRCRSVSTIGRYTYQNPGICARDCACKTGRVDCSQSCACVEARPMDFCQEYTPICDQCIRRCNPVSEHCVNEIGGPGGLTPTYRCECERGYEQGFGAECKDIDECTTNRHNCDLFSECCVNIPGSYWCHSSVCPEGWNAGSQLGPYKVMFVVVTTVVSVVYAL